MANVLFSHQNVEAFPVGSVFFSAVATDPSELLGYGEWTLFGEGRMVMGCSSNDTPLSTGGSNSKTISTSNLPAHTHSVPAHKHTASAATAGEHGHENSMVQAGTHGHKYTMESVSHNHTVTINSGGSHTHSAKINTLYSADAHIHSRGDWTSTNSYLAEGVKTPNFSGNNGYVIVSAGSHTHSSSVSSNSHTHTLNIVAEGAHTHEIAIDESGNHTHSITINNSSTLTTGSAGSGSALDITNAYIKLFIWRRTK